MNASRRNTDKYKYLPFLWQVLVAIVLVIVSITAWFNAQAVSDETLKANTEEIKHIKENYVTSQVLDLTLVPMHQDIEYTKEAIKRIEITNWKILGHLKDMNDEPTGAHSR